MPDMPYVPALPSSSNVDYVRAGGVHCADGAHILFIPVIPMGSIVMRGLMPMLILNQTFGALHNVKASYLEYSLPHKQANMSARIDYHIASYGPPSVCVVLKYPNHAALRRCRSLGALVMLDCIDNHRCFSNGSV